MRTDRDTDRNRWQGLVKQERGQELVEMALVVPLLLMLLIGIFWLGRGYNTYQTITHAAREGARLAVTHNCATCGNAFPTDDEIRTVINNALLGDSLDPTEVTPNPIPVQRDVVLNPGSIPQTTGVVISFGYPFQIFLPFTSVGLSTITISTQVQMREEH